MDLRSILNVEDRPKLATRSKQGSRPDARAFHSGSVMSGHSTRLMNGTLTLESFANSPTLPTTPSVHASHSVEPTWMSHSGSTVYRSNQSSSHGKSHTSSSSSSNNNRPRISLSTSSASSVTIKRRASANSPVSYSSSSCSSPSPRTPSSMTSSGIAYSCVPSGVSRLQGKSSPPFRPGLECHENTSHFLPISPQDSYMVSALPMVAQTNHIVHTAPVHFNRLLPPPSGSNPNQVQYRQLPMKENTVVVQQATPKPVHTRHASMQRLCSASTNCENTTPKRRIVSQFFGRNKKETRLIPRHCWVFYCRQHYQRSRYRLDATRFAELQMSLVRTTVSALEKEGIVLSWEIKLRKRAQERLVKAERETKSSRKGSGSAKSASTAGPATRERTLLPYCGAGKSFHHVYEVLDSVNAICRRDGGSALEFELLPSFTKEHQLREEARRRACREDGYGSDSESDDDD